MTGDLAPARLYRGGRVLTPAPTPPGTAVATVGDRVVAVGPEEACVAALPRRHEVLDLAGRTVAPGFVDAHLHPLVMCVFEQQLALDGCRSVAEVLDLVADRARETADRAHEAVVGFQLDGALLAEGRLPTGAELDAASGGRRVVLVRRDGHNAVASTAAIEAAGLAAPGSEPAGGRVDRDAAGRPTGVVRENAVAPLLALLPEVTLESLEAGLAGWRDRMLHQGVTGISAICQTTAEGPSGPAGELEAIGWSVLVDRVPFDVQTILIAPDLAAVHEARNGPLHRPDHRRRVDAVKLFLDGTLGGHTACMHQAFSDQPGNHGMRTLGDDDAYARMVEAHLAGFQVCVHAIGDAANRSAADLFSRLLTEHPGPHRHRVEHASVLDGRTVELLAAHDVCAVVQPVNLHSERHWLTSRIGPERAAHTYPYRALLDAGVTVAGSSDAPIERTDVLEAMAAAVHRDWLAGDQAITAAEALALYTTGSARARRTEADQGALRAGFRADLVVLDADPTDPARLTADDRPTVLATVIGGVEHHRHPDLPRATPAPDHAEDPS